MIKKLLLTLVVAFAISNQVNAQAVTVTESFDNTTFVPTGWALKPVVAQPNWVRSTNSTFPTVTPHSGAAMARFRSRTNVAGVKQQLVTKAIDYTNRGTTATNVSFWMYRDDINTNYDSVTVYVNNTDSIDANAVKLGTIARNRTYMMPDTQATNAWYNYSFAIPTTFSGNMTTHLIFEGNCENIIGANQGANMTIDDVSYEEFPAQCTGTPNVGSIVNPTPVICGGSGTANLSVSAPINGLSGITYTWQVSNSASGPWSNFGGNSSSVTTGTLSINTYVQCVVNCSFSSSSYTTPIDSIIVSSNPVPLVQVSPSTAAYCAGSSTGALLVASGANTYSWSPALGLDTIQGNVVIAMPAAATQYTVIGTDSNGCAASATVNVTISNPPTISFTTNPTVPVCAGTTVIINPIQGGGPGGNTNTYAWSDGKTTRRDTVVVNADMTLTVTVTNQAGCSSTDSIAITALPAQNSNFGWSQTGSTFNFADSTNGSTSWSWDFGDGNTSINQNPTYTYSQLGEYYVTLVVVGPCKTDTITKMVGMYPEGISDVNENASINLFPNPTSEVVNISLNNKMIEGIRISNLFGEKVYESKLSTTSNKASISVKELPKGIYTIQVISGKNVSSSKFTKQ